MHIVASGYIKKLIALEGNFLSHFQTLKCVISHTLVTFIIPFLNTGCPLLSLFVSKTNLAVVGLLQMFLLFFMKKLHLFTEGRSGSDGRASTCGLPALVMSPVPAGYPPWTYATIDARITNSESFLLSLFLVTTQERQRENNL